MDDYPHATIRRRVAEDARTFKISVDVTTVRSGQDGSDIVGTSHTVHMEMEYDARYNEVIHRALDELAFKQGVEFPSDTTRWIRIEGKDSGVGRNIVGTRLFDVIDTKDRDMDTRVWTVVVWVNDDFGLSPDETIKQAQKRLHARLHKK